jgi:hypothetical protein
VAQLSPRADALAGLATFPDHGGYGGAGRKRQDRLVELTASLEVINGGRDLGAEASTSRERGRASAGEDYSKP